MHNEGLISHLFILEFKNQVIAKQENEGDENWQKLVQGEDEEEITFDHDNDVDEQEDQKESNQPQSRLTRELKGLQDYNNPGLLNKVKESRSKVIFCFLIADPEEEMEQEPMIS